MRNTPGTAEMSTRSILHSGCSSLFTLAYAKAHAGLPNSSSSSCESYEGGRGGARLLPKSTSRLFFA